MQLQVHTWRRTLLIIKNNVKKQLCFDDFQTFSPTPGFSASDVTHYNISDPFWFRWTQNTPRIPKMYSFMRIWTILEKLFSFKVIATLRDMKTKQNKQTKRRKGKSKNIWLKSYIQQEPTSRSRIYDFDWVPDWLTEWLIYWLTDWLTDWLIDGWLTHSLADWMTD